MNKGIIIFSEIRSSLLGKARIRRSKNSPSCRVLAKCIAVSGRKAARRNNALDLQSQGHLYEDKWEYEMVQCKQ